jgi:hypoxanthine-DNA glycosylase
MSTKHGLGPIVDAKSRALILGTLPGDESLRQQRYYSDPSNRFWNLLSDIFGESPGFGYAERLGFLGEHGVALWDVLQSARRPGSSDTAIADPRPNDFGELFATFSDLRRVGFNGTRAESLWRRYVRTQADVPHASLVTATLPSSSGTPGRNVLSYDEKLIRWRAFLAP